MMMRLLNHSAVAGLLLAGVTSFAAPDFGQKIVGGTEASIGEFPFIVSLQTSSSSHFCGGSLVKRNWVLTAAHCVKGATVSKIAIGLHDRTDLRNAEVLNPKRIIAHPSYNSRSMDYDYALIELERDSNYEPVSMALEDIDPSAAGASLTTAGWGATREGSYSLPKMLQRVDVPYVTQAECSKAYTGITDRMVCAGFPGGGKDACQGDSGGPLTIRNGNEHVLVGVVSWGEGCARPNKYGVYAKVSAVQAWINQYTK